MALSIKIGNYWVHALTPIKKGKFAAAFYAKKNDDTVVAKRFDYAAKNIQNDTNDRVGQMCKDVIKQKIEHKNVIKFLDNDIPKAGTDDSYWLFMEKCDTNLSKYFDENEVKTELKLSLMHQCADGMAYLHQLKPDPIVHRRLKPENILLSKTRETGINVKISDYQIAGIFEGDTDDTVYSTDPEVKKLENEVTYNPEDFYKAPEYFSCDLRYPNKPSYDVFCMGLVFCAIINHAKGNTLLPPIQEKSHTPVGKLMADNERVEFFAQEIDDVKMCEVVKVVKTMLYNDENERKTMPAILGEFNSAESTGTITPIARDVFQRFKQTLYQNSSIAKHIQFTYTGEGNVEFFIVLDNEDKGLSKKITDMWEYHKVENQCTQLKLSTIFHERIESEWLMLMHIEKCIGPGSILFEDEDLEIFKVKEKIQEEGTFDLKLEVKKYSDMRSGYGTIGCFAQCNEDVYILSVKHLMKCQEAEGERIANMVCAFEHDHEIEVLPEMIKDKVKAVAKDFVHISENATGYLGTFKKLSEPQMDIFVDVALYGPIPDSAKKLHGEFKTSETNYVEVTADVHQRMEVKKVGATTGFTRGIVIVDDYGIDDKSNKKVQGAFLVTSYNNFDGPEEAGNFARKGDSGSLVFVDEPSLKLKAIGIVHGIIKEIHLPCDKQNKEKKKYTNVIICVRLDYCIEALQQEKNMTDIKLLYYYLQPKLYLAQQKIPRTSEFNLSNKPPTEMENTEASNVDTAVAKTNEKTLTYERKAED